MRLAKHMAADAAALFLCLGIPCLYFLHAGTLFNRNADAVSGASLLVPEQPSGTFLVLLNRERHPATMEEWSDFFRERDVDVIMEDISCLASKGDVNGLKLADRYLTRLAQNQMNITVEDGTLIASKAEAGIYDVIILSKEAAEAYGYEISAEDETGLWIAVSGGET